ncbi:MAG: IS481 family transposase [Burkholderiaceae bacterium]|nr:IS481 family transposase [Burkholderiaceae bacterium]
MDHHKNARLTYARRLEMVRNITEHRLTPAAAAAAAGVSEPTARKWLGRFLAGGEAALADASSRPASSPRRISESKALAIVELRKRRLTQARIAISMGVSEATVSRVLRRAGLSKLSALQPAEPVQRYEHAAPGDLLHIDTKKLGRIERMSHRITGNRRDSVDGAGWEFLFVAIDDHARIGFTQMHPDERAPAAVAFLQAAVAYYSILGVTIKRLLTDNGGAFRSHAFRAACKELGIRQKFTRAYRPQTNGKAERFIQSALREWAYGIAYNHSHERTAMLAKWQHHYNWHRPHAGIGGVPPITRLQSASDNNVLTLHT